MKSTIPLVLIAVALLCPAAAIPNAQAVSPPPDGGYPNFTTAEGQNALLSLTSGAANTAVGWSSLLSNAGGSFNTATGAGALLFNTADANTAFGAAALLFNTTGDNNTAVGAAALSSNIDSRWNTAIGANALQNNTGGLGNTANGFETLRNNTFGNFNVALGFRAGSETTGNSNIDIDHPGVAGESNTIRIGTFHSPTYIAGIRNVPTGIVDAIPVLIDSAGQLGTMSSSRGFKKEIKSMDRASEAILALKPVTFHYKSDKTNRPEFGLIAEEVAEVNPNLVVSDKNGEIYTVRYDAVNAMLLNEFLKEHRKVQKLEAALDAITARLNKQESELQKVVARVEVRKAARQIASKD
jgi:hypothetical protein